MTDALVRDNQLDVLNVLSKRDVFADGVRSSRSMEGGSLFVSFSVPGEIIPCTFRHRYLITPDGTITQLPFKMVTRRTQIRQGPDHDIIRS